MNSKNLAHQHDGSVDVIVIGGGISGLGVAVEAQRRGHKTLLLERSVSLATGTSANSLKIIHGGFRYLQTLQIGRVLNSIVAQGQLVRRHPNLFEPLPCLMRLERFGLKSRWPVTAASLAFGIMARGLSWPAKERRPCVRLDVTGLVGAVPGTPVLQWWDWRLKSHEALVNVLADEFTRAGGVVRCDALVVEAKSATLEASVISEGGDEFRGKVVIDCRGSGVPSPKVNSWAVAFNLLLSKAINPTYGIAASAHKRLLFAVPRPEVNAAPGAVGTWYVPGTDADPFSEEKPEVSEQEIAGAIADVNAAIPEANLQRNEVVGIESGVLPCVSVPGERPIRLLGRERIETFGRIIKVVSTKYTTFETQARWAVNTAEEIFKSNRPKPPTS